MYRRTIQNIVRRSQYSLSRHPSLTTPPPELAHIYELQKQPKKLNQKAKSSSSKKQLYKHTVSKAESGLKTAVQLYGMPSEFITIGISIESGNRNEGFQLASGKPFGLTHLIEKLAWKDMSTRNRESVQAELDEIGAVVDCIVSKDVTIYAMTVARNNVEIGLDILAEAVFQPELTENTLDQAKGDLCFEVETMIDPTQQEQPLSDAIHSAAFGITPYAFPKLGDPSQIDYFKLSDVKSYLKT